jgi:hypothetical protein
MMSALDGDECSASRSSRFIPGEGVTRTLRRGGGVGLGTGVDIVEEGQILHFRESNLGGGPSCR